MAIIKLEKVSKIYITGQVKKAALDGIDLEIQEGEMVGIMGPSGCGKSTALNIIGCLDKPTDGKYIFDNKDVSKMNDSSLSKLRSVSLGFVFQSYNLLPRLNALANVKLALLYGNNSSNGTKRSLDALRTVGIADLAKNRPAYMSGGQQQRVGIARALVKEPRILLADEPTGNLDSRSSLEIMGVLQRLNIEKNLTMIIVTHEDDIASHLDRIVRLSDGKIVSDKPVIQRIDSTRFSEVSA